MTNDFQNNRNRLKRELPNSLIIVSSYDRMQLTNDMAVKFIQEANFLYLTDIHETGWLVVIDSQNDREYLVQPEHAEYTKLFEGTLSGDEATKQSAIESFITYDELKTIIKNFSGDVHCVFPTNNNLFYENPAMQRLYDFIENCGKAPVDCRLDLARLRAIKQPYEIDRIHKAIDITCRAFEHVMTQKNNYNSENEIEAEFNYYFTKHNATHGYDPIVASGRNACTLHYDSNNQLLVKHSLVLMDIGAKVSDYTADITRTIAIGEISDETRRYYEALETAHRKIISLIQPNLEVSKYMERVDEILSRTFASLGLIENSSDKQGYRKYFPHAISHGLGLDTHDRLGRASHFLPGMVLTVEPGLYVPEKNIGIRIEDNILVTSDGSENLSSSLTTDVG